MENPYAIPVIRPAYLDPDLVLWLAFWSTNIRDYSRFGNHAELKGATWSKGRLGSALNFDGVDDYLEVKYSESLNLKAEITIELRLKINKYTSSSQGIISKYTSTNRGYLLKIDSAYENKLSFTLKGSTQTKTILADTALTLDKWYHLVCLKDSQNVMGMYINGLRQDETNTFSDDYDLSRYLRIGRYTSQYFSGVIEELRLYRKALSPQEIARRFWEEI